MPSEAAHRFDPTVLREYDVRGIVGQTLSLDLASEDCTDGRILTESFGTVILRTEIAPDDEDHCFESVNELAS